MLRSRSPSLSHPRHEERRHAFALEALPAAAVWADFDACPGLHQSKDMLAVWVAASEHMFAQHAPHISAETWAQLKTANASGIGLRELARNMNLPEGTVLARAKREGWSRQIGQAKTLPHAPRIHQQSRRRMPQP